MKKFNSKEGSITKNLKIIEWLKTEILDNISKLFKSMVGDNDQFELLDIIASIIMAIYLLAQRLGYSFDQLDRKLEKKIQNNIDSEHQIEEWYGDLSKLLEHLRKRN
ncbi:MazG-like family protein [Halanaerobaculum tunisiense]